MIRMLLLLFAAASLLFPQNAQMTIDPAGPVNAASYIPAGLPNSGVAQGAIFIVKGTNLCETGFTKRTVLPYETSLKETSIQVSVGTSSVDAFMIYVYGGLKDAEGKTFDQIAAILPSDTPVGDGVMGIRYKNNYANAPIKVLPSGPGLFTLSQAGRGPGVISDNQTYQFNTITNSFTDKTWTNLWVTGLGPISGYDNIEPPVGNLKVNLEVWIGGQKLAPARIAYFGRAPKNAGLDQIAFQPPPGVTGCSIPVFLKVDNFISNTVTMSLGASPHCSDPLSATPAQMDRIQSGQPVSVGRIVAARADFKVKTKTSSGQSTTSEGTADVAYGRFSRYDAVYAPFSQEVVGLPSLGNCVVTHSMSKKNGSLDQAINLTSDPVPHKTLNAGQSVGLNGGQYGTRQIAAPSAPSTGSELTDIELTFENKGTDNAHVFSQTLLETFPGGTKLAVGGTRVRVVPYALVKDRKLDFTGGRGGVVIATGSKVIDGTFSKLRITFDESATLKLAASGGSTPGSGLAMFQGAVSSGYYKLLGGDLKNAQLDPDAKIDPLFLSGGAYTATTTKTADVGAINAMVQIPASSVDWPDKNSVDSVTRSQGYTIRWTGGDASVEHIAIYGHSAGVSEAESDTAPGSAFVCTAPVTAKQFSIPANILLQLPASQSSKDGILSIGTSPLSSAGNFSVEGVESGRFTFTQSVIRSVTYK